MNKAKEKLTNFDPRGSKCPICKAWFRNGCNHTVQQARDKLFENYIKELINDK